MNEKEILKFAKTQGYNGVNYIGKWRTYEVYEPVFDGDGIAYVGLPYTILVDGEMVRMSTDQEALEQIEDMPD